MSQDRLIDAALLSTVCEPDFFDGKDCFELGLEIIMAFHDASSGTLRDTIQNCSVPDRSLDFLPFSPPDMFSIDSHSFDTFPFPNPLLGSNA
jgi:hypothetical protein